MLHGGLGRAGGGPPTSKLLHAAREVPLHLCLIEPAEGLLEQSHET